MFFKQLYKGLRISFVYTSKEFHTVLKNTRNLSTVPSLVNPETNASLYNTKEFTVVENEKPKYFPPKFNIAAYVNKSNTLQELIKLGVNLHKIGKKKGAHEIILGLDFERDVKKYIKFLHGIGVPPEVYGEFLTKNPFIFKEDFDNLQVRINYLESKNFTQDEIVRIISKNPLWLSYRTRHIDSRLGFFQGKFQLAGSEVRFLAVKMPKLITSDLNHIEETYFSVKEELGFRKDEIKTLILSKPKIFTLCRKHLIDRFCFLHSTMGLDHKDLLNQPGVLLCRQSKMRERHEFLQELKKAQYDPLKPGYIAPITAVSSSDAEFCSNVCKVPTSTYNKFLKTIC